MEKVPLTAGGFEALVEELRRRQQEERPRIIQAISEARALGDLSENAEYHAAKEAQALNEGRVQVIDEDTEEERTYQIVGEPEADVRSGRVSITSPIARALIGKTIGDTVEVSTPGGGKSYEITGVAYR